MRSTEFIMEKAGDREPETDAEYAARMAQGQKNLDSLKGFGSKIAGAFTGNNPAAPAPAPAAPTPLTDREGNPIASGTPGVYWNQPAGKANPSVAVPAPVAQAGKPNPSVSVPAPAAEITPAARDRVDRTADIEADAERERIAQLAGVGRTPGEAQVGQGGTTPAPEPAPAAPQAAEPAPATQAGKPNPSVSVPAPAAGATPLRPGSINFDTMSFGQAFKAAKDQGLKTFPWKGGSYSTAQKTGTADTGAAKTADQRANIGKPGYDEVGRPGGGIGRAEPSAPQAAEPAPAAPAGKANPSVSVPAPAAPAARVDTRTRGQRNVSPTPTSADGSDNRFARQGAPAAPAVGKANPSVAVPAPAPVAQAGKANPSVAVPAPATAAAPAKPAAPAAVAKPPMTAAQVNQEVDRRAQQAADAAVARSASTGAPVTGGGPKVDRSTFEESVDQMRRLSTMLKG